MGLFRRTPKESEPPDDEAPGWDAIDAAMKAVHGDDEPVHKGLVPGLALGSPLQGVSAYAETDHWHFVTYGLTELFVTESEVADINGFGYELTMRVPRAGEDPPPDWPFELLAKVAAAAWAGNDFATGHRLQVGGPITYPTRRCLFGRRVLTGASSSTSSLALRRPSSRRCRRPRRRKSSAA